MYAQLALGHSVFFFLFLNDYLRTLKKPHAFPKYAPRLFIGAGENLVRINPIEIFHKGRKEDRNFKPT